MRLSMDPYSSMQLATAAERCDDSKSSNSDNVDFVQSLNTTLCFLCWVNVDATVVEAFLKKHPEAMLLEGTSQDSAYRIVLESQKKCKCHETSACKNNRKKLLAILEEGFGHYQNIHMQALLGGHPASSALPNLKSLSLFPRMMTVGRHLRSLQIEESAVRSQVLEIDVEKAALLRELEQLSIAKTKPNASVRIRSLFSCGSNQQQSKHEVQKRNALESRIRNTEMKLMSAKQEHKLLVGAINQANVKQYELLSNAFSGCCRHMCKVEDEPCNDHVTGSSQREEHF